MSDPCPRCTYPLRITGVQHDQFAAVCDKCTRHYVWNEATLDWDRHWSTLKVWANVGFLATLLWLAGHTEVM